MFAMFKTDQGDGGQWRWFARTEDDEFLSGGPPQGFDTEEEALEHARNFMDSIRQGHVSLSDHWGHPVSVFKNAPG